VKGSNYMYDSTPWGMIHKQKELNLKHAELQKLQSNFDGLEQKVKNFMKTLEQVSVKLHTNGNLDDIAFRKLKRMIKQF